MEAGIVPYFYSPESVFKEHLGQAAYFNDSIVAADIAASWHKILEQKKTLFAREKNLQKLVQNDYIFADQFRPVITALNQLLRI
jgi:hypothetical protein